MNHRIQPAFRGIPAGVFALLVVLVAGTIPSRSAAGTIDLILPTGNTAIYEGNDSIFYQRTASGRAEPWNGGRFGFVRNPRGTREGTIYTRYHEGIDIRPLYRDASGQPLDSVVAVSDGRVVHVSNRSGGSNYGKYIVVEHIWGGSPYYSLYAHLGEIWVDSGAEICQGALLGRLGYTGAGINRSRAHLHFEIALMLNENFQGWFESFFNRESNHHGCFNGWNLIGVDVARLYLALRDDPELTMQEFLADEEPYYDVAIPLNEQPGFLRRYPWMQAHQAGGAAGCSWRIAFTRYGLPLRVEPGEIEVTEPRVTIRETSVLPYRWLTKSMIAGYGENYSLSESGRRYMELLLMETRDASNLPPAAARSGDEADEIDEADGEEEEES